MRAILAAGIAAILAIPALAQDRAGEPAFRALYKELVETNTTLSAGDCTKAATQVAARLKAAGFADSDLTIFSVPEKPKEGGLVAIFPGTSKTLKPILLLAHIDVVEAKREDWTRDPFTLIEEGGYFYARGVADDKAMAAIFADSLIRWKSAKSRFKRTLKLALTCGEETNNAFNGAEWLSTNRRQLIDAQYALNEGGGGRLKADGTPLLLALQVGEKASTNYTLEVTNPGGHSSMPRADNAIYTLARAVEKVEAFHFPTSLNDTTRAQMARLAPVIGGPAGDAMRTILATPDDPAANALLRRDPLINSTLRTTCVATLLNAGHAENALPQRARANINCRIFPGQTIEQTQATLAKLIDDPLVTITPRGARGPIAQPPALDPRIVGPMEALAQKMFPGVAFVPIVSTGATDAIFLAAAGIPTYGVPGILFDQDGGGVHGLNERIRVKSVLDGRDYLHTLVATLADSQ
ncbi:M20/M25/M40 family metallo-hydrolase [Sandaracinobacteroides saxicola]|uniref:M20/M25/M40 family metallo-hydrolase n=1 Tax=Sandaracinobacteroides saxicola TaxID=2759707 RepID=A0A7G5IH85_9SPHN|nr:M20/M25/M40 family metallo-hydrolase [Sandaracinobacteroides saxicola]QMW22727.1 M20/M25/M40 family metallo-hydrolase [Sandaracinobacteroides saxicola]